MENAADSLDVLASVSNELHASAIVNLLNEHGIQATSVGEYTSGFKAESPGYVNVFVMHADIDRAKDVLATICDIEPEIDQSEVPGPGVNDITHEDVPEAESVNRRLLISLGVCIFVLASFAAALVMYILS